MSTSSSGKLMAVAKRSGNIILDPEYLVSLMEFMVELCRLYREISLLTGQP